MLKSSFSPKIEIINYFDRLINRVDIDIEVSLEKYKNGKVLGELACWIWHLSWKQFYINFTDLYESSRKENSKTEEQWPETTKVVDYLNQVRMRTIAELRKAQEDALEHLKLNPLRIEASQDQLTEDKLDELKSQLFTDKFYYQVHFKRLENTCAFSLFTIVTDFYLSPTDIALLHQMINRNSFYYNVFSDDYEYQKSIKHILNKEMVLIGLIIKYFWENLETKKWPSHMINVSKQDILHIKDIIYIDNFTGVNLTSSSIDLSNLKSLKLHLIGDILEEMTLEGLSSLETLTLKLNNVERASISNLPALRKVCIDKRVYCDLEPNLLKYFYNIEKLVFNCVLSSDIKLNSFVHLKSLILHGKFRKEFGDNFDLFKNLCKQLEELSFMMRDIDDYTMARLFYGHHFPNLLKFFICSTNITKLEKKMFDMFPKLQKFQAYDNMRLEIIDLLNSKHLSILEMSINSIRSIGKRNFSQLSKLTSINMYFNKLEMIEEDAFSNLTNLETLDLGANILTQLDPKLFIGLEQLKSLNLRNNKLSSFDIAIFDHLKRIESIDLEGNSIANKEEILNRIRDTQIKVKF